MSAYTVKQISKIGQGTFVGKKWLTNGHYLLLKSEPVATEIISHGEVQLMDAAWEDNTDEWILASNAEPLPLTDVTEKGLFYGENLPLNTSYARFFDNRGYKFGRGNCGDGRPVATIINKSGEKVGLLMGVRI